MAAVAAAARVTTTVYIVRHGTSEWNKLGLWQGQKDTLLAPEGEAQARAQAQAFAAAGVRFDAVYCSPLRRASAVRPPACSPLPCGRVRRANVCVRACVCVSDGGSAGRATRRGARAGCAAGGVLARGL